MNQILAAAVEAANLTINCLGAALLCTYIQRLYESGMILRRYYVFLNWAWIKLRKTKRNRQIRKLLKPLGLCVYCQGFWIFIIINLINWNGIEFVYFTYINYLILKHLNK